ncbi:radical SAM protein (plasmid) [Acidiphilium multivorum]|nr:radical SAM protein [Acidiphilium multivorum]
MSWQKHASQVDASVNFTLPTADGGMIEARFVQRDPDYFIVYLSSHTGCRHACRFCHLTATGQTMMVPVGAHDYVAQANRVLQHAGMVATEAKRVHYNFMARGEALSNPDFLRESSLVFELLGNLMPDLASRFLVSSIIPDEYTGRLDSLLTDPRSMLYYSLYSTNPAFRRRWLPRAKPVDHALDLIADYQARTGRAIALHWAFIAGENDDPDDVATTLEALKVRGIKAKFNLVRYNPHDQRQGAETEEKRLTELFRLVAGSLGQAGSRIVPRVGSDIMASCGMFFPRGGAGI